MWHRKVVVDRQVFSLGLKEFEESVANEHGQWPTVELQVGDKVFLVGTNTKDRALLLHWCGLTSVPNILWFRFIIFRLRRPLVKKVECFSYASEEI